MYRDTTKNIMEYCIICAEELNQTCRKSVNCPFCEFEACITCCQTYILDREANICMNVDKNTDGTFVCQKPWTRKFMVETFPKKWLSNEWRSMNEKVKFEREKSLLPATMPILERKREEAAIERDIAIVDKKIQALYEQRSQIRQRLAPINRTSTTERSYRGRPCPDDNCRGFLSSQWKCGACDMWTCPECHSIKGLTRDAIHTCNPDDVATARLLNSDTKPCPSCTTPIHKLTGCDQMWCTQCHTGFSWRTGAIQRRVHNPHFFEWQRNNNDGVAPRRIGDVECGRDLGDSQALMSIRRCLRAIDNDINSELKTTEKQIETIVRGTIHLSEVQINRFRTDELVNNQDLRLRYLEKQISEKKLKSDILRRDKAYEKKQDIYNVIQVEVRAVTDIIYRLEAELTSVDRDSSIGRLSMKKKAIDACCSHIVEIHNVTEYCNNLFKEHAKTYNCKNYQIDFTTNSNNRSRWRVNDVLV